MSESPPAIPASAAELEATEAATVTIQYQGESYEVPANMDDVDGEVLEAVDRQKLSFALEGLLGSEQWKRFKGTKPKVRDYGALFELWAQAIGLESLGE